MKLFQRDFDWTNYFTINGNSVDVKEGKEIEFKESFHSPKHKDKILLKWIASFANASGGLIVFGIKDNQEIIGLKNTNFRDFDSKDLTQELNNFFSPEIIFEIFPLTILHHELGFLYIHEGKYKPIIASKTGDKNVREGDIYYRYSGESKKILYPELTNLLSKERDKLNDSWINLIQKVATVGVENVGILNVDSGEITGNSGSLFLDKGLLPNIKFIKEGSFDEVDGAPALKIVGEVIPTDSDKVITITEFERKAISIEDIIHKFLDRDVKSSNAYEYLKDILSESTKWMPIYYFIQATGQTKDLIIEKLKKEKGRNKIKIMERINSESSKSNLFERGSITYDNIQSKHRLQCLESIRSSEPINMSDWSNNEYVYFLESITHIKIEEYDFQYLNPILKRVFDDKYEDDGTIRDNFGRAICHLDLLTYGLNLS